MDSSSLPIYPNRRLSMMTMIGDNDDDDDNDDD